MVAPTKERSATSCVDYRYILLAFGGVSVMMLSLFAISFKTDLNTAHKLISLLNETKSVSVGAAVNITSNILPAQSAKDNVLPKSINAMASVSPTESASETVFEFSGPINAPAESLVSINPNTGHLDMKQLPSDCPTPKAALLGVPTTTSPESSSRRNLLREIYRRANANLTKSHQIDFIYVFGNGNSWEKDYYLTMEEIAYPDDTFITDRLENMNEGKTLDWLLHARNTMYTTHPTRPTEYCLRYKYIGKTDDDVVIHIPRLSTLLLALPTNKSHFIGRSYNFYMTGMLYLFSPDIIEWIHQSPIPAENAIGHEDMQVGVWLQKGHLEPTIAFQNQDRLFHDLEESPNFSNGRSRVNASVVIHWCKDVVRLFRCFGDLYGTPGRAVSRLTDVRSLRHHKERLEGMVPALKGALKEVGDGTVVGKDELRVEFNIATQLDGMLMRPAVEEILEAFIKDAVSEQEWTEILTHMAARVQWLKDEELAIGVLRAVAAMGTPASDSNWERDVAHKLKEAVEQKQSSLTWDEVKKIRGH
ncbi:hypothetical protein BCR33DRAFT_711654 [Rhizoclosmatium globosum]|uniref:Hexosyltransferase n=1 Tax=Rhizoclosmatium globosum TaxID=329046 RepID=A0A1Y2CZ55_9FUNG|nr:hypothetical protein BCR33DRAFT_711654 [Rhizoclosmatium globosum]|eukprot:ORY52323.1 hypothetical protein BCR33DRAFT_711654 [Rhizoclosmatium globosum]